ncbi:MAG TPA: hypothetical protein PK906_17485 [Spirochaetota bacterium]|nr:hypothetical protein [Spirochaetota bacterium]
MERSNRMIIKKYRAGSSELNEDDGFIKADPSYLFNIMWDLTMDAWAFKGNGDAEQRLQRNITNFSRRTR